MGRAFKCDRCGDFSDSKPRRFKFHTDHRSGPFGWKNGVLRHKVELCEDCGEQFKETVDRFLGGGDR